MARIDSIFKELSETKKAEQHPKRITKWIHYTKLHDNKDQYCDAPNKEAIEALADLIEADGEVLQDLLVRKTDTDEYEIVAGHKRRNACRLLVEERGKEKFAFLPCYIKNESDVRSEFRLYSTNGYHEKTEYEKMHELERMKYLLENYPEEFPQVQTGRMVERLAKLLNMKKTTVGEYLTIARNLGDKGMEKFRSGELKKSAAVELSGMPEEEQDQLIDQGITTHTQIRQLKCERKQTEPERQKEIVDQKIDTRENLDLKNNEQRKEWLRNYKTWGIWYTDENIGCTYYKYDFANGACLIAETYHMPASRLYEAREVYYLHLVGGPEPPKDKYGIGKWERHEVYNRFQNNETELVEFLKHVQKEKKSITNDEK